MIWPTDRAARTAMLLAVVAALLGFVGLAELGYAGAAVLSFVALADAVPLLRRGAPQVRGPSEIRASLRRPYSVAIGVDGLGVGEVALDLAHALGGPASSVECQGPHFEAVWQSTPRQRGVHQVSTLLAFGRSPLGLWQRRYRLPLDCRVRVAPDLRGPGDDSLGRELTDEGVVAVMGLQQAGSELRGLRPFQSGDDPRHVDWKATARAGHPIVREWQPDRRRSVLFALDAGRLMRAEADGENKLDAALRALLRLAMAAEARGDQVGALVYGQEVVRWVPPLTGAGQAERLLRAIGDVSAQPVESDLTRALPHLLDVGRRALVVVVTDVVDRDQAEGLTRVVAQLTQRHLAIVALLRDPHLDEALHAPIDRVIDAYRRAASEMVALDRAHALDNLRARGVRALDLSMRNIALQVVQAYLGQRMMI